MKRFLSTEHFSVDGTLIQAWASMKSFAPIAGPDDPTPPAGGCNTEINFRGETRANATHASSTDPDARLYRKGAGMQARLAFLGQALMENRSGLIVDACLTQAKSRAKRVAVLAMIEPHADRPVGVTLGADKGCDASDFVNELRRMKLRPPVARNTTQRHGRSAIGARTTRHAGYAASQRVRKRIEEAFGWMKTVGGMRRAMLRGTNRIAWAFTFVAAAYNLVRLPKLLGA